MVDLSVTLPAMPLDNQVIPASGTFGYGREFASYYDINILGSFSINRRIRMENLLKIWKIRRSWKVTEN